MKKIFKTLILLFLIFIGCEKSEVVEYNLTGTLMGRIYTYDEVESKMTDNSGLTIKLEGGDPLITTKTDSVGDFELLDIPAGTYNFIISKEDSWEFQRQGYQIVGGDEPIYYKCNLIEKSTTTIENLLLEVENSSEIHLKGIVNHNYTIYSWSYLMPYIYYFINDSQDVSDKNYMQKGTIGFYEESGSSLDQKLYIDQGLFPSGSEIFIVAYGANANDISYYDISSNQYIHPFLGTKSNIASIIVP